MAPPVDGFRMPPDRFLPSSAASASSTTVAGAVRSGARIFLSGRSALRPDGSVVAPGDPTAQTHAALDRIEEALSAAGGSLRDITRLTTSLVDRAHRKPVYEAIGQRLRNVFPVSTGLIVGGLPLPELMVQIDADAVVGSPVHRLRTFEMKDWFGQDIAWQGAMVAAGEAELFIRGQTGAISMVPPRSVWAGSQRMRQRKRISRSPTWRHCCTRPGRTWTMSARSPSTSATVRIVPQYIP
jgi:enamine deaminase RidA (YjgF/YER057c/UK114 family)